MTDARARELAEKIMVALFGEHGGSWRQTEAIVAILAAPESTPATPEERCVCGHPAPREMATVLERLKAIAINDPVAYSGIASIRQGAPLLDVLISMVEVYSERNARLLKLATDAVARSLPAPILLREGESTPAPPPTWKAPVCPDCERPVGYEHAASCFDEGTITSEQAEPPVAEPTPSKETR